MDLFPVRLHSIVQIGVLIELIILMTAPAKTGCQIDMTPEVPPGTTVVEGETPGTFVQNNVFEGQSTLRKFQTMTSLVHRTRCTNLWNLALMYVELGHYIDMLLFAICERITLAVLAL